MLVNPRSTLTHAAALRALRHAEQTPPPIHTYNRAMRRDLRDPLHREDCRAEYDKAEALGDLELGRWARAWGEAIRCDLRDRFNGGAY